jgi:hypothetical protein
VKSSRERGKNYDNIRPTHDRIINKPRDDKYVDILKHSIKHHQNKLLTI